MSIDEEPFSCEAKCDRETEKAIHVQLETGESAWVPKSVVHADSEVFDDDENSSGVLVLQHWWAEKEGLA